MKWLKKLLGLERSVEPEPEKETDRINKNYICLANAPEKTINNLNVGDTWNDQKVREGLAMGILRHPTELEIAVARQKGLIVNE